MTLRRVLSLFVLAALVAAGAAFAITYRIALREIEGRLDQSLILTRRAIESEIERFRYLPGVAAEDARIAAAIRAPQSPAAIAEANRYLAVVAAKSGADTLYLLTSDGLAIAASNWATPQTFIGGRYDFRPYFTDAMHAGRGRFYAIGVTTGQPGYFISTRVDLAGGGIGVMVVKINLEPLQRTWQSAGVRTSIADQDGVVFLTAEPGWLYAPLAPLPAVGAARITRNRTYSGVDVAAIPPLSRGAVEASGMAMRAASGQRLWARATRMQDDGWTVISAAPVAGAIWAAALWAMGAALVAMAGAGVGMILRQSRQMAQLRLSASEGLERKVAARTRDLAREIEARRQTEADLRAAQEGLVHSEKMAALGRMSAAIVHEISQPLAAMEATLAAAARSLPDTGDKAATRIATARALIKRMLRTIKHLKSFSRKEPNVLEPVDVAAAIRNAVDLVAIRAKAAGIMPRIAAPADPPMVRAGAVRLEQVLVNLLLNALDAVEGAPDAAIAIACEQTDAAVTITVRDTGKGMSPADLARATEPFFSTKISGESLGLGLAISTAIIEDFGGAIAISSAPGSGASVTVTLPRLPAKVAA
jgi:two-component system C4-dicarboxylate transport sensor histidine kinase DctB